MQKTVPDEEIPALEELMTDMVRADYALLRKERRRMIFHRIASTVVSLIYILSAYFLAGSYAAFRVIMLLILPLAAI